MWDVRLYFTYNDYIDREVYFKIQYNFWDNKKHTIAQFCYLQIKLIEKSLLNKVFQNFVIIPKKKSTAVKNTSPYDCYKNMQKHIKSHKILSYQHGFCYSSPEIFLHTQKNTVHIFFVLKYFLRIVSQSDECSAIQNEVTLQRK